MLVPELQKMSCQRGLYKICSVLGTPTTAWTLAPESSAHAMLWKECMKLRDIASLRTLWSWLRTVFDGLKYAGTLSHNYFPVFGTRLNLRLSVGLDWRFGD